jgi:hypothetical protein
VIIDNEADFDRPAVLVGVELQVYRPDRARSDRSRRINNVNPDPWKTAPLRHPQALLEPEALDSRSVPEPFLTTGMVAGATVAGAGVTFRVAEQLPMQRPIKVHGRGTIRRGAVNRSAHPASGHAIRPLIVSGLDD